VVKTLHKLRQFAELINQIIDNFKQKIMKRKMIFAAIAVIATLSGIAGFNANFRTNESSDLTLADVEAEAGWVEDWWNRPDYDCVSVTCRCIMYSYRSEEASYVGNGNGSVAHQWSCAGCGDCGWT